MSQSSYRPVLPLLAKMTNFPAVAVTNNFDLVRDCPPAQSNKEEEPSMNNNTVAKWPVCDYHSTSSSSYISRLLGFSVCLINIGNNWEYLMFIELISYKYE